MLGTCCLGDPITEDEERNGNPGFFQEAGKEISGEYRTSQSSGSITTSLAGAQGSGSFSISKCAANKYLYKFLRLLNHQGKCNYIDLC